MLINIDKKDFVEAVGGIISRIRNGKFCRIAISGTAGVFPFVIGENKPFVLIVPGGAYQFVGTFNEGFMVAMRLNELGYNAFVCDYGVGKNAHYPKPQDDIADILRYILNNAESMHVLTDGYAICGSSAGGHLAASWGAKDLGYLRYSLPAPKAVILCYPVITMGRYTHKVSRRNLLAEGQDDEQLQRRYSIEHQVDSDYPDTYIWHCVQDKCVSYQNSYLMEQSLTKNGVRHVVIPYKGKAHGWGLALGTVAEGWLENAVAFWQDKEKKY